MMLLCLDSHLIRTIALKSCNRALLMTCKEVLNATTASDRILMAIGENNLDTRNALVKAINANEEEIVQSILDISSSSLAVDPSPLDDPLYYACNDKRPEIVKRLLDAGADVHAFDDRALIGVCYNGCDETVKYLLEAGADARTQDSISVVLAFRHGHMSIIDLLLAAGADVRSRDEIIKFASYEGNYALVERLLAAGADVDAGALINACMMGHYRVVELLLKAGADVNAYGSKALKMARTKGFTSIVELLRNAADDARA